MSHTSEASPLQTAALLSVDSSHSECTWSSTVILSVCFVFYCDCLQWKKYWFVLTDHSLRYYKDSIAEEVSEKCPPKLLFKILVNTLVTESADRTFLSLILFHRFPHRPRT